jgi:F-type H+/Na+-transporting ATPase subunit alpha
MQLMRGEKLTELLKQPQYEPMKMEDQVAILYGATKGYVNDIPTPRLQDWAKAFLDFLHQKYAAVPEAIASSGQLSDETKKKLDDALTEFNKSF